MHDAMHEVFHCLFLAVVCFILGHKIAARSARLHLEKMKKIWGKT